MTPKSDNKPLETLPTSDPALFIRKGTSPYDAGATETVSPECGLCGRSGGSSPSVRHAADVLFAPAQTGKDPDGWYQNTGICRDCTARAVRVWAEGPEGFSAVLPAKISVKRVELHGEDAALAGLHEASDAALERRELMVVKHDDGTWAVRWATHRPDGNIVFDVPWSVDEEQIFSTRAEAECLRDTLAGTPQYPEHEKLRAVSEKSQACGAFLDWLLETYTLAKYHKHNQSCTNGPTTLCGSHEDVLYPETMNVRERLAEFFQIDEAKLEEEKVKMLAELRQASTVPR